jgi:DNA-binding transcriptional MerR regulator
MLQIFRAAALCVQIDTPSGIPPYSEIIMSQLTIGQLANKTGVSRATLRYYEEQALIEPAGRTESGYRLYDESASKRLLFIQRAQRLGFALADIRNMIGSAQSIQSIAERRYIEIERQLTELLVQRHEMAAFLNDIETHDAQADEVYQRLVDRVCAHDHADEGPVLATLERLLTRTGCALTVDARSEIIEPLMGRHMHIWRDGDGYKILIPDADDAVADALEGVAALEAECHAHATPQFERTEEGCVFIATGENAFLFAQLFLDIEAMRSEG